MSRRSDEIQAAVHPVVRHLPSVDPGLCIEVVFEFTVDVINDRLPAGERHYLSIAGSKHFSTEVL